MFVGRERELAALERAWEAGGFGLFVIYGRRRVGKSALVRRFAEGKRALLFTAKRQSDKNNLRDFSRAVWAFAGLDGSSMPAFDSWSSVLAYVAGLSQGERMILAFDELPYAAEQNPALLSDLQVFADEQKERSQLLVLLCGSSQGFMESKVLGEKSPIYGRRTGQIRLRPFDYLDAAKMLGGMGPQDQFAYYACLGGVPYYLERVDARSSFEENIERLYFDPAGVLFSEPSMLLREELRDISIYNSVIAAVAGGRTRLSEISDAAGVARTSLPSYLASLSELGIVHKRMPYGSPQSGRRGIYVIGDPLYGFWYRFVARYIDEIESGAGRPALESALRPGVFETYLGGRFETVCVEWLMRQVAAGALPFAAKKVGRWWGTDPARRCETDIDVLAADPDEKRLLIGECKYRTEFDETGVLSGLREKRDLIEGYRASWFYIFGKHAASRATQVKYVGDADVRFLSLADLYENG